MLWLLSLEKTKYVYYSHVLFRLTWACSPSADLWRPNVWNSESVTTASAVFSYPLEPCLKNFIKKQNTVSTIVLISFIKYIWLYHVSCIWKVHSRQNWLFSMPISLHSIMKYKQKFLIMHLVCVSVHPHLLVQTPFLPCALYVQCLALYVC